MPPRKSRASRIIGERAVRSMAASTSASAAASVPSTISKTTGSTTPLSMHLRENEIAIVVHAGLQAWKHDRGRTEFFHNRWALEAVTWLQLLAVEDGRRQKATIEMDLANARTGA